MFPALFQFRCPTRVQVSFAPGDRGSKERADLKGSLSRITETFNGCGPGKSNHPFELRRKAGDCSRVTAGPDRKSTRLNSSHQI